MGKNKMNIRYIPKKHACIHVVVIGDYQPEMCKLTLPNLKAYADRIGADFNIIDKRVFDKYPIYFEEFQVYELGKDYKYNMLIDVDFILGIDVPDFTKNVNLDSVGYLGIIDLAYSFKPNNYFARNGRLKGISDAMVVSTYLTHDVWSPPLCTYDELKSECLIDEIQATELWVSINLARFGLSFVPIFTKPCKIYHAGVSSYKVENPTDLIRQNLKLWESLGDGDCK
jgi:hypothetical protein